MDTNSKPYCYDMYVYLLFIRDRDPRVAESDRDVYLTATKEDDDPCLPTVYSPEEDDEVKGNPNHLFLYFLLSSLLLFFQKSDYINVTCKVQ